MNGKDVSKNLTIFNIIIGVLLGVLLGRLFYMQIIAGDKYRKAAFSNVVRSTYIPAPRGMILDRNGKVIAHDVPRINVCAVISEIESPELFARKLSPLVDLPELEIKKILDKNKDEPYKKIVIKPRVEPELLMKVAERQPDIPGLYLEVHPVREYPNGEVASHILGYVGEITDEEIKALQDLRYHKQDTIGKDGIELEYDRFMHGVFGEIQELVDVSGKALRVIQQKSPKAGNNIYLTIDLDLQRAVESITAWYVHSLSVVSREPLAAAVVVQDVRTGEILAMASVPNFDPNKFAMGISNKDYNQLIKRKDFPLINRAISAAYPPASTFKMVTSLTALQEGVCTPYSPFICPGYKMIGNQRFNCFVKTGHGRISFTDSIAHSCDVSFYILGQALGPEKLIAGAEKFGLGKKTGIDLPGEIAGLVPSPDWKKLNINEQWYTGDTVNMAIGQGYLTVTPLQLCQVVCAVASGGAMHKPHLLYKIEKYDKSEIREIKPESAGNLIFNPEYFTALQTGMRQAVLKGTAKGMKCKMTVSGKTGTAENSPSPDNPNGRNHTWFAGYAPADDPEIAIVVFFERSGGMAGSQAVPIANEIVEAYRIIKSGRSNN